MQRRSQARDSALAEARRGGSIPALGRWNVGAYETTTSIFSWWDGYNRSGDTLTVYGVDSNFR